MSHLPQLLAEIAKQHAAGTVTISMFYLAAALPMWLLFRWLGIGQHTARGRVQR